MAQAPPLQHTLHLDLGSPVAVLAIPDSVPEITRGRCVWSDGDGACPSAVVLFAVARHIGYGLNRQWTYVI
jgi:hypothetical protein